jgi:hypothetical protein
MPAAIVSGALANKPFNGGEAWVRLSWILGLARLGFDVHFVEEISSEACVDAAGLPAGFGESANRAYFESVIGAFGLQSRAGLLCDGGAQCHGLDLGELTEAAAAADVLVDISGHLTIEPLLRGPRVSVYVDLDPGFTQAWHADGSLGFRLGRHDRHVSVGLNVGRPGWPIPAEGVEWLHTLPPVVLEEWGAQPTPTEPVRFTTVATWRSSYGAVEIEGRRTNLKHHQMRRMIELPEKVDSAVFEIALDIHPDDSADLEALREHGWRVVEPRQVTASPRAYREYVSRSGAEFSVAQGVYAEAGSGWFSDRTAAYLACGRPALVQDTGLEDTLPLGEGLLSFASLDQAIVAAERIAADPTAHSEAARRFAEEHLDSDRVLSRLLSAIGVEA